MRAGKRRKQPRCAGGCCSSGGVPIQSCSRFSPRSALGSPADHFLGFAVVPAATLTVIAAESFALFGSETLPVTDALFVTVVLPLTSTVTWMSATWLSPFSMSPTDQVTVPVSPLGGAVIVPLFTRALTNVTPLDNTSVTTTLGAV